MNTPPTPPPAGRLLRLSKGVGALVVLLAAVIGVPVLLVALGAAPAHLPTGHDVTTALTSRDDGHLVGVVLAAGAWICWALFTLSALPEIVGVLAHRPVVRLPGLGAFQRPAGALVALITVGLSVGVLPIGTSGTAARAGTPVPLPVAHAPATQHATSTPAAVAPVAVAPAAVAPAWQLAAGLTDTSDPPATGLRTYQVARRDTLWGIAERHLGDPLRYPEIARLNAGTVGADNEITPGTVLRMPVDATGLPPHRETHPAGSAPGSVVEQGSLDTVRVRPGDTLWGIEQRVTGDGVNWTSGWQANQHRAEPGGVRFDDPDLIRPGWTLDIPRPPAADQAPVTGHPAPPAQPAPAPPAATTTSPSARPSPPATGEIPTTEAAPRAAADAPTPPAVPSTEADSTATVAAPPRSRPDEQRRVPQVEPGSGLQPDLPMVAFAGGGLLLAGLSLSALRRYRRRQFRARRPGRTINGTPPELLPVERAVLSAGSAGIADVTWLDQALRGLVQVLARTAGARLPDVVAVCLTDDLLQLVLTGPAPEPPAPWAVDATGTRWSLHREDPVDYQPGDRGYHFAPFPTLTSVGYTTGGEHWLLDLERVGALALSGDPQRCLDLARFLAAELAHNAWSAMLSVTLVGFGAELTAINPDRLTYTDDVEPAVASLQAQLASVTAAMRATDVDVLTGRLRDIAGDAWAPHVLLLAPQLTADRPGLERLLAAMREQGSRAAVALVLADGSDHPGARWQLTVDARGVLRIPALGVELIAQRLPAEEASQLAQLLARAADTTDTAVPAAHGDRPWDRYADACGGLRPDLTETPATPPAGPAAPQVTGVTGVAGVAGVPSPHPARAPQVADSVLPLPAAAYLDHAATTEPDLAALAPPVSGETRHRVQSADPDLDADLADWDDPSCSRPKVTLLGPVAVRAQGPLPGRNPRLAWHTEIVAYLVTRPRGVTSERFGTDLWPNEADITGKTKVRQSISIVRQWLGENHRTGGEHLPKGFGPGGGEGTYRIEGALIDAELFRRLRLRGVSRGPAGIVDLHRALNLVQGVPFDNRRSGGYDWLADTPRDHEYAAMIVDVAHIVATHRLGAGEPELAANAAQFALLAGSSEDVPLLDLVAACDAQGNRAEAAAYVKRILANHDAEVEEDLPVRTAEILFRRQRLSSAS